MTSLLIVAVVWLVAAGLGLLAIATHAAWWVPAVIVAGPGRAGYLGRAADQAHDPAGLSRSSGHARFLAELLRPEIRQYFVESNTEAAPFDRETRDMVYERAKGIKGDEPFGTERDVYALGYEFLRHSLRARVGHRAEPQGAAGRPGLRAALRHRAAQRLGDELRCAVGQRDRSPQRRRGQRRFRPRHRRGRDQPVPPQARWRPDLGDRLGLLRLPRRRRPLRRGQVRRRRRRCRRSRRSRSSCPRAPSPDSAGCCPARR